MDRAAPDFTSRVIVISHPGYGDGLAAAIDEAQDRRCGDSRAGRKNLILVVETDRRPAFRAPPAARVEEQHLVVALRRHHT